MLSEFARYERLVVDVAKGLYKRRHARRQRVPRGFATGFELRLTAVNDGSVIPVLELPEHSPEEIIDVDVSNIFDEARLLIQETLRAVSSGENFPSDFPMQALREFSRFGRSLRDDETISFDRGTPTQATYSQAVRRSLQERAQLERFEVETLVTGQVVGLLADKAIFEYRLAEGGRVVPGRFSSDDVVPDLKQYLDLSAMAPTVAINAVAIKSIDDSIIEIQDVLSIEPVLPPDWSARLSKISELQDGWMDGSGEKISRRVLRQTESLLLEFLDEGIGRPRIFPSEKGSVHLEWTQIDQEVTLEVHTSPTVNGFAFSKINDEDEEEREFSWSQVEEIVDFVRGRVGHNAARQA